jgi:hypothetical protein
MTHTTNINAITQELPAIETMRELVERDPEGVYGHGNRCEHESVIAANGEGAFCRYCGETLA